MKQELFLSKHKSALDSFWDNLSSEILPWFQSYEWGGVYYEEAMELRNGLENEIKNQLESNGFIDKSLFDEILEWGFKKGSKLDEKEIKIATKEAFFHLQNDEIKRAAIRLLKLNGIGISRASKVLALSNQDIFGIYDSRVGDALRELKHDGKRLIKIPPGRVVKGDINQNKSAFAENFENVTWVFRYFLLKAQSDPNLRDHFRRVSDIEIALFSKK